ncbi:hypothetical protein [Mycolicibacterium litorale]|nr:hypothetical protein [Mycolicibacterium litorale]MCV7414920.1 hypothetical protein [Mycolicibacterium litorale]
MSALRIDRHKAIVWARRYVPCEVAGTTVEFGGAALAYLWTGSFVVAALAGTIGASVGYYATAYTAALRWSYRSRRGSLPMRVLVANGLALRSVAIEFGPAEAVDSLVVRPLAFYVGPQLFGGLVLGWVAAKVFSDVVFYALAIGSYERFGALLARRPSIEKGQRHEPRPATTAA